MHLSAFVSCVQEGGSEGGEGCKDDKLPMALRTKLSKPHVYSVADRAFRQVIFFLYGGYLYFTLLGSIGLSLFYTIIGTYLFYTTVGLCVVYTSIGISLFYTNRFICRLHYNRSISLLHYYRFSLRNNFINK